MTQTEGYKNECKPVIIIRPGIKKICGADACRAAILNQLLYCIAWKSRGKPGEEIQRGEVYWFGSSEVICQDQLDDSWGICKVRKEIKALVASGMIGQRHNPYRGFDQTRHYFFGEKECSIFLESCEKAGICLYCQGFTSEVLHLIKTSNGIDKSIKCICLKHQMHLIKSLNPFDESINAIPEDTTEVHTEITTEKQESVSASASHIPPLDSSSQEIESEETSEAEPAAPSQVSPIATETPATPVANKTKRPARSKKQASTEPLAPPARPDPAAPWNVEKCLAWGDYFRGFAYPHSERSNSKSYQEREAARAILGRGKTEEKFIKLMCYMRGVTIDRDPVTDPIERSDWWPEHQPADIKHAHENWDKMSAEYRGKKAPMKPAVPSPSAPVPSTRNGVVAPLWQGADAAIHEAKAARQAVLDEMAQKQKMSVGA